MLNKNLFNSQNELHQHPTNLFKLYSLDLLDQNSDKLLSENLILDLINSFWVVIFTMHKNDLILAQIQLKTDTNHKSLSSQIIVSFSEKEAFTDLVLGKFREVQSKYKDLPSPLALEVILATY